MSSDTPTKKHHRQVRNTVQASVPNANHVFHQAVSFDTEPTSINPSTPPRTPRKNGTPAAHATSDATVSEHDSRYKQKNKPRPKNVKASPAVARTGRQNSPPKSASINSTSKPISTPSSTAYAGSTFHASPAPSALPLPSYYSKSVPDSPSARSLLQKRIVSNNISNPTSDSENGTNTTRERTPLDFLFEADRQDKERARSASSGQHATNNSGPFYPPYSPSSTRTPPHVSNRSRPSNNQRHSGGLFHLEMDIPADTQSPVGPAFSTPYGERIKAARIASQSDDFQALPTQNTTQADDLKRYLFDGILPGQHNTLKHISAQSQPQLSTHNQREIPTDMVNQWGSIYSTQTPRNNPRYSSLRQEVTPSKTLGHTPDRGMPPHASPIGARQQRDPHANHGMPTGSAFNKATMGGQMDNVQSPSHSVPDLAGLDNHLRTVLNLRPANGS